MSGTLPERKLIFGMMSKALNAVFPLGSGRCRRGMRSMDEAFRASERTSIALALSPEQDEEARLLLRARCALCPNRCRSPLM